ncbi:hypothetical protein V6N11_006639 [Hibiscus sabdariffa]|uniref:Uncharacterized protein n=1 Tax=Hibiscus sabdariffa TaxID=183260 RepID=A0ABR2RRB0_9ROSI
MNHQSVAFKNTHFPSPPHLHHHHHCNPIHSRLLFPSALFSLHPNTTVTKSPHSSFTCRVLHTPLLHTSNATKPAAAAAVKTVDVATLGNLCVDIVLNVPKLPPPSPDARKAFMEQLSSSPPDKRHWEAGGNCNMAIAAARLGLKCITIGHVGNEIYGKFLLDVLRDEGIGLVEMSEETGVLDAPGSSYETLLCWVLVDPSQKHGFCSRADFSKEPAFSWINTPSEEVKRAIKRSRVLFCNGYDFDELSPNVMISAVEYAVEVGTSVFFDPGPRGKSLLSGTVEEQKALRHFLRMSDVLLLTADEAESLTGVADPILAGKELLKEGNRAKWVLVKMGPKGSILITKSSITCAPAFKVKIMDTVGCGDSFVAAIAFGFIHNIPLVTTLAFANAVGAATAMGCGAGRNVATLKKVVELIETPDLNENDKFWNELLSDHLKSQEVLQLQKLNAQTLLSPKIINKSLIMDSLRSVFDLPESFRSAFNFRYFNSLQSECFPVCFLSDVNAVISAPTASGKTVLFELCILRLLSGDGRFVHIKGTLKTIYIAPSKALLQEKPRDWTHKFGSLGINCLELTGDNESYSIKNIQEADIILTPPEKFDAVTRYRIKNGGLSFFSDITLLLIDEVHLLNDLRGAALEAIVSRIKMLAHNPEMKSSALASVRLLAVSATIPNIEDLDILMQYSRGKSALVFCSTRKGAQEAAQRLSQIVMTFGYSNPFVKSHEQQERLREVSLLCSEKQMLSYIIYGVGYHNGGLSLKDRNLIEGFFLSGDVQVLCTTNTLAHGINLPAHTVVIKSTQHFNKEKGLYMEYDRSMVLQMSGRAGQPPFDDTGTVIIMARRETNPQNYVVKKGIRREQIEKHIQEICVQNVIELSCHQMVQTNQDGCLEATRDEGIQLRRNEKKLLNNINGDKDDRLRFHVNGDKGNGKNASKLEKIRYLFWQDANSICSNGCRIAKCMKEYFIYKKNYRGALNSSLLAKSLYQKLWDDNPFLLKQLPGVGMVTTKALHSMGIISFETLAEADPRRIETVTGRKFPFGNHIKVSLASLPPNIDIKIEVSERQRQGKSKLAVTLTRLSSQGAQSTKRQYADMIVASEEENLVLFHEKISVIHAVGLDIHEKLLLVKESDSTPNPKRAKKPAQFFAPPQEVYVIEDDKAAKHQSLAQRPLHSIESKMESPSMPSFNLLDEEPGEGELAAGMEKDDCKIITEQTDFRWNHNYLTGKHHITSGSAITIDLTDESENQPGFGNATLGASKDAMVISELEHEEANGEGKHLADLEAAPRTVGRTSHFPVTQKGSAACLPRRTKSGKQIHFLVFRVFFNFSDILL